MYYIYKITNNVNNKIYIGVHKSNNIKKDPYMGSGKLIEKAINKYGIDNFKREILFEYSDKNTAYEMEAKLVNLEFVNRLNTYNIKTGGVGGWDYIIQAGLGSSFKGHRHSELTKKTISNSRKGQSKGVKNSQYGTCWIMNESLKESKKIKKNDLQDWLDKGWSIGRKIKWSHN